MTNQPGPSTTPSYGTFRLLAFAPVAFYAATRTTMHSAQSQQTLTVLHTFTFEGKGGGPAAGLTMDQAGDLYGTTSAGDTYG